MKLPYQMLCALIVLFVAFIPQSASAKCVVHSVTGNSGVSGSILAVVPDSGSADLAAAGYQDASCGTIDKTAYREQVCKPGLIGNHGVQRQLEMLAGVSFAQLCAAAQAEAGLPPQAADTAQGASFSPSNRRAAVPRGGPGMVGPLGPHAQSSTQAGGN